LLKNTQSQYFFSYAENNPINDIDELSRFEITFKYEFTPELLTERAKKQLLEVETIKENISEGDD
jgi:hypothetical protein